MYSGALPRFVACRDQTEPSQHIQCQFYSILQRERLELNCMDGCLFRDKTRS